MSEEPIPLRWGDIIRIHGLHLSRGNQEKGLIISKGFTDPNIYYQKFKDFQDVNFYRQSLFQVLPRGNFDCGDQILNQTFQPGETKQNVIPKALNEIKDLNKQLEAKATDKEQKRKIVTYGMQVVFKHVESQSYLRGLLKAADSGDGAFRVQVAEYPCSNSLFKLTSHRSYEHQADNIYYNDELQIYHTKSDCYMNFAQNNQPIYLDSVDKQYKEPTQDKIQQYQYFQNRPSSKRPNSVRISVINQNKSKCYWRFIQHCSFQQTKDKKMIKSHDIVYFSHTKNHGLVSSTLSSNPTYYMKEFQQQRQSYQCFWELIPKKVNQFGPQDCKLFWARNIVTGSLLTYDNTPVQIKGKAQNQGFQGFQDGTLINLQCTQGKYWDRGQIIAKDESVHKIISYYEESITKMQLKRVEKLNEDSFAIYRIAQDTMIQIGFAISSHQPIVKFLQILSSRLLDRPRPPDSRQNNKQNKQVELYNKFYKNLFKCQLDQQHIANLCLILKSLTGRIYGTTFENIQSSGNIPNPKIQQILVQTGIAQLIIEIIFYLEEPFIYLERLTEPLERSARNILDLFNYSYKLLEKIAISNQRNRIYMSRWTDLFLQHSKGINRNYIQQCLVGILQNNPISIEATINQAKIESLIYACFEQIGNRAGTVTTKYLKLFETFIKCQNRVIKKNQNIILHKFFKNTKNPISFKFKLQQKQNKPQDDQYSNSPIAKIRSKQVLMAFGNQQQFSSISKFFKDWRPRWNYFMAYVNLLADVCMDRNIQAITDISASIQLPFIVTILFDPDIEDLNKRLEKQNQSKKQFIITNVHEPFLRVAHYVYIVNQKFSPIKRIKKISNWYRYEGRQQQIIEEINHTKRPFQGQKEQQEKKYLDNILQYIKQFIEKCDQKPNHLSILYTVLDLFQTTIILGLWESIKQFKQLISYLVMKITKIDDDILFDIKNPAKAKYEVDDNIKQLRMNRPEITKAIQCKIKATNIFKCISEMQVDIRLRYVMNFFKGLYQATQKFETYNIEHASIVNSTQQSIIKRNQQAQLQYNKRDNDNLLGGSLMKVSEDQQIMMKPNIWYNKLKQMTPFDYVSNQNQKRDPVKDRYLFSQVTGSKWRFEDIVLALFELSSYHNTHLLNNSLKMLGTMFEQRASLMNNFKQILICGKGNLKTVYLTVKYMRTKFSMLQNPEIVNYKTYVDKNFPYPMWKTFDVMVKEQTKKSGLIQDLFFLSRTLKDNTSLKNMDALMQVDEEVFKQGKIFCNITERQKNNSLFQSVNLAEGIYIPLIQYIRHIGQQDYSEFFNERSDNIQHKLLFSIYQYLTFLCFNNLQVKQVLMQYIPDILPHLHLKVNASSFLYEVSINNKLLVNNQQLVDKIIDGVLNACLKLGNDYYEKSRLLFSLKGILLFNNEGNSKNQQKLMNKLQVNQFRVLIYKESFNFIDKCQNFNLSAKETYVATVFELFSTLVESKNFINIGKLENIHKYTYCLECLKQTNRWQIRRSLRAYINRLYYVNKQQDIFLFEEFIREQFSIINKQFTDLIELHKGKSLKDQLMIKNGIRFIYAQSEIFLMIIQLLISLHEMFLKPIFVKMLKNQLQKQRENDRKLNDQIIKLAKNLGCMSMLYPNTKPIGPFIRQIKKLLTDIMLVIKDDYLAKRRGPQADDNIDHDDMENEVDNKKYIYDHSKTFFRNLHDMVREIKAKQTKKRLRAQYQMRKNDGQEGQSKQRLIDNIFSVPGQKLQPFHHKVKYNKTSLNPNIQTASSKIFKVLAKPDLNENQQNIELNRKLTVVKEMIDDLPTFKKLKDDEFISLVSTFTKLESTGSKYYSQIWQKFGETSTSVFKMESIIGNIFTLIMNNPNQVQDRQKIFVLKLVRCYITQALEQKQDYKLPVDLWDSDYFPQEQNEDSNQFKRRQQNIEKCGGSAFIISIMKQAQYGNRVQLLNQALLLGIAYLFNGNSKCQQSILQCLKEDPDNKMLVNINFLINQIGQFLINTRKNKQNQRERQYAYQIVDTYDFYDVQENILLKAFSHSKQDKFQKQMQEAYEKALCRMFRFMQLFCENNNINMKKFILKQTNSDGSDKLNTIDFINTACTLLGKLFKIMNNQVVAIPCFILDFLTETTQVPCINNQKSLLKSTFFEDISYMAGFFENKSNLTARKLTFKDQNGNSPLDTLMTINEKAIELALSNFEGNDDSLISQFINKCQPKFIWIAIRQNLVKILKERGEEQFGIQPINQQDDDTEYVKQLFQNSIKVKQRNQQKISQNNVRYLKMNCQKLSKIQDYTKERKAKIPEKDHVDYEKLQKQYSKAQKYFIEFKQAARKQYAHIDILLTYLYALILQIQINSNNGQQCKLQNIYFPNHPLFKYLSDNTKQNIMINVERQTQRDKLLSLLSFKEEITSQIKHNYVLFYNKEKIFNKQIEMQITSNKCNEYRHYARYISCVIITMMLFLVFVDHDTEEKSSNFTYTNIINKLSVRLICFAQLIVTLIFLWLWIRLRKPLALNKYDTENSQTAVTTKQESFEDQQCEQQIIYADGWSIIANSLSVSFKVVSDEFEKLQNYFKKMWVYNQFVKPLIALYTYESDFKSILIFVIVSFMGNFYGVEWYTIHLFDFFVDISLLANVFKSIIINLRMLATLSGLAGAFILVFNVVSLGTYVPVIYQEQNPSEYCETILDCVLVLYISGAICDDMDQFVIGRFFFDTIYIVFMQMLFQNLVGGIMIDCFTSLKEKDAERDQDKNNLCYICGMSKPVMQKQGQTFKKHKSRHNLWNYIYYLFNLKMKPSTNYTGLQYEIDNKVSSDEIDWFPALGQSDSEVDIEGLIKKLQQKMTGVKKISNEITSKSQQTVNTGHETFKLLKSKRGGA